jgi:small-conductance mechanosensitive channel
MINFITHNWVPVLWSVGILAGAVVIALIVRAIVFWVLGRMARRKSDVVFHSVVKHGARPSHWIFPFLATLIVLPGLPLPHIALVAMEHITSIGLIASFAWLAILLVDVSADIISGRYRMDVADNLTARRIQTQFGMLHKVVVFLVVVVALAIILMTFSAIRSIGDSLLASAGLASLVVGLAAKGTLSNLVAGIQIAFTQPFRIGDAVVIEGEWGWIEELGTMFVVVRIWDLRRLVLPLSYFLEHSFQNWTRTSADLLGHCFIYVDYTVPVDPLRDELRRICESTKLWGGKVCVLQVSDCEPTSLQLRALMDARNSGDAWDLRCLVREKMIDFIQKNYPGSLPRYRGEFATTASDQSLEKSQNGHGGSGDRALLPQTSSR